MRARTQHPHAIWYNPDLRPATRPGQCALTGLSYLPGDEVVDLAGGWSCSSRVALRVWVERLEIPTVSEPRRLSPWLWGQELAVPFLEAGDEIRTLDILGRRSSWAFDGERLSAGADGADRPALPLSALEALLRASFAVSVTTSAEYRDAGVAREGDRIQIQIGEVFVSLSSEEADILDRRLHHAVEQARNAWAERTQT